MYKISPSKCVLAAVMAFALSYIPQVLAKAGTTPNAQQIVALADGVRNPGQPFRVTNTLVEYVHGKPIDSDTLVVFAKENKTTGQYRDLVQYAAPPRDAGKSVLLDGSEMWFYDPDSHASVRISPQQRLLGQASDADVVTVNLAHDYTATLVGDASVPDYQGRSRVCWHLNLKAATSAAMYSRIDYWVEKNTFQPIKAKYYADSGQVLNIAYYGKYQEELGGKRPTEIIILDAVNKSLVTVMNYSDFRPASIPDAWFQRSFLPNLTVQ